MHVCVTLGPAFNAVQCTMDLSTLHPAALGELSRESAMQMLIAVLPSLVHLRVRQWQFKLMLITADHCCSVELLSVSPSLYSCGHLVLFSDVPIISLLPEPLLKSLPPLSPFPSVFLPPPSPCPLPLLPPPQPIPLSTITSVQDGLKELYHAKLRPLESAYLFNSLVSPALVSNSVM